MMYRIEMMTAENYDAYMMGSNDYTVRYEDVDAENETKAVAKAEEMYPNYNINKRYVRTVAEIEVEAKARRERHEAFLKAEEERKAKARAKRAERKAKLNK